MDLKQKQKQNHCLQYNIESIFLDSLFNYILKSLIVFETGKKSKILSLFILTNMLTIVYIHLT